MFKFICLALFIASTMAVSLEGFRVFPVNSNSDSQVLQLVQNDKFAIQLTSNPSTGYDWYITNTEAIKSQNLVTLLNVSEKNSGEFESDPNPNHYSGVGGKSYFKVQGNGNGAGQVVINLEYKRSWENAPYRTLRVVVELA